MKEEIQDIKKAASLLVVAGRRMKLEKRGAEHWGCCPFHNEKSASFAIKEKNNEQVFYCQGCGKGGDVIRFVEYIDHCTTKAAIDKLKAEFGIGNAEWRESAQQVKETFHNVADTPKKTYTTEAWAALESALLACPEALDWLDKVRGIGAETVKALHLGYAKRCTGHIDEENADAREKGWVLFPRVQNGKIVAVKLRSIVCKAFSQFKDMDAKALFNVESISPLDPVFLTEGELDTAALVQAGYNAVSVPNANSKLTPEARIALKQATCIYLAGDNDGGVGNAYMKQLQREFSENTFLITWPDAKDANEFFLKNCNRDVAEFQKQVAALMEKARNTPVEGFTSLLQRLRATGGTDSKNDPRRFHLPADLAPADDMAYSPAGSMIVFYSTYSGTGKTKFITQVEIDEAKRGETVVVYSPELADDDYLSLIASQTVGFKRLDKGGLDCAGYISRADYEETAAELDKPTQRGTDFQFYVGHSLPYSDTDDILEFIEHTVRTTGATRFVIDTVPALVNECVGGGRESKYDLEGRLIKRLSKIGIQYGTTFILIGQSNKEGEGLKETRKDEFGVLRGSRELSDICYAIYLLHRKRTGREDEKQELENDALLIRIKGRQSGKGPKILPLHYKWECSTFFRREGGPTPDAAAPESDGETTGW